MVSRLGFRRTFGLAGSLLLGALAGGITLMAQQPPLQFGGAYSELDERRQRLVDDWVLRFVNVTGQSMNARSFYDDVLGLSTKTTFDAVTHALLTTPLTDASGQKVGDGLALIERVDTVKGEVSGASSDHQFRLYVRLTPNARETLERSREFKRTVDNTVYHKGYPLNYRSQRGAASIQISVALDGREADVDVVGGRQPVELVAVEHIVEGARGVEEAEAHIAVDCEVVAHDRPERSDTRSARYEE